MRSRCTTILVAVFVFFAGSARAQEPSALQAHEVATESGPASDTNAANNPVNPQLTIDLQNYVAPSPGKFGDEGLFRVSVPIDLFGLHQFVRTILPINTPVSTQGGPTAGVGDLTVYDLVLSKVHGVTIGLGPLIAAPTARSEAYGSGKWQAGAAGIALKPFDWGLLGVLINYQHSFSGNSSSPVGQITTVQPIAHYNFHHGFYLRSTGVWTFNSFAHVQYIPLGFGVGKVWKRSNGDIVNFYVEPQYSVYHSGVASPKWQIFAGATFKFPMGKRLEKTSAISLKGEKMVYEGQYKAKLTDSHSAVEQIASNSIVAIGQAVCQPPALMEALAARAEAGSVDNVKVYYMHSEENMKKSLLRYELMGRIKPFCMFVQEAERDLIKNGQEDGNRKVVYYVPNSFSQSVRFFADHIHVDTFLVTVSPMDRNGYFTFGTNNDYTSTAARTAKRLIVEVNRHMPRVYGSSALHISEVDAIVENDAPLLTLTERPIQEHERKLGQRIAELIPEHACLQIGVGGVPSGVCEALVDRKDLGIHTEVLNPALAQLIQKGVVTNRWKKINPGKSVFTFAMGDEAFYDFLHDNIAIESHPVNYVNDPAVIAQNDHVVSVNSTIEMDLTGACNSEYVRGHQFTSTGGQLDFVRGAYASQGGMSFIAFQSAIKDGKISKIVPRLSGPVTTPRTDVHYVVTENGVANLKGLSSTERAQALIALAHPNFQEGLTNAAKEMHLL